MTAPSETRSYEIKPAAQCGRFLGSVFTGDPSKCVSPHVYGPRADWAIDRLAVEVAHIVEPLYFVIVESKGFAIFGCGVVICKNVTIRQEKLVRVKNSDWLHGFVKNHAHTGDLLRGGGTIGIQQSASAATYLNAAQTCDGSYGHS